MNGKNAVWYGIGADISGLEKAKAGSKKVWQQMGDDAENAGIRVEKVWQKAGMAIGGVLSAAALKSFVSNMVRIRGEFQQLEIAFTTMLKSGEKSKKLMSDLAQFAAETPFGLQSAASGAKQLLAYGSTAETVVDELRMIGDVAAGTGQSINDIVYLYGTLRTQGRAYMMDIRQFAGRGIPIYDELANILGVSKDRVNDFVSAGKVGFKEIEQAFKNMTSASGLYGGLMEEQSKSITGRIEQLRDAIDMMFNSIGESGEGVVYSVIGGATTLVENYEKIGKVLIGLISTYGAYKAALIAVAAYQKAAALAETIRQFNQMTAALRRTTQAQILLNQAIGANPYIKIGAVILGVTAAVFSFRKETNRTTEAMMKEEVQLNNLFGKLKKTNEGTSERNRLIKEINDKYGSYLNNLLTEESTLKDIESAQRSVNAALREKIAIQVRDEAKAEVLTKHIKNQTSAITSLRGKVLSSNRNDEDGTNALLEQIKAIADGSEDYATAYAEAKKLLEENNVVNYKAYGGDSALRYLSRYLLSLKNMSNDLSDIDKEFESVFKKPNTKSGEENSPIPSLNQQIKDARSNVAKLKQDLADLLSGKVVKENLAQAIEDKAKEIKDAEDKVSYLLTGKSYSGAGKEGASAAKQTQQIADQQEKVNILIEKQVLDRKRAEEDLENQATQARIEAMRSGFEKTEAQRDLDNKLEIQNLKRQREDYIRAHIEEARRLHDEQEELNQKRDKKYSKNVFDPTSVSVDGSMFNQIISDTEKKQALKELDELTKQYQDYYTKRLEVVEKYRKDRERLEKSGASEEQLGEFDYQTNKVIEGIDSEFAMREDSFQAWADQVINLSLEKLTQLLAEAEAELERMEKENPRNPDLAVQREKVTKTKKAISKAKAANAATDDLTPGKRTFKEWKDLQDVLRDVAQDFGGIGDAVGGAAGALIKEAGAMAASTLLMINGIVQLSNWAVISMQRTAQGASAAMIAAERASVILAIISAALQIITAIFDLFKKDDTMDLFRREVSLLNDELERLKINARIENNGRGTIFGEDAWRGALKNIDEARNALINYNETINDVAGRKEYQTKVKITGINTGGSFINRIESEIEKIEKSFDSLGDSIGGMQIQIQHSTWFRKSKHTSLKDAVPELFDNDGSVNMDALKGFLGTDTFKKLSQENQDYLQSMVKDWEVYQNAIEEIKDYFSEIFGDLGEDMSDALVDAFRNGTDAAEAFSDSVSEMLENLIKQMAFSLAFGDALEKAQNEVDALIEKKGKGLLTEEEFLDGIIKATDGLVDNVLAGQDVFNAIIERAGKYAESLGQDLFSPDKESREGTSKGIESVSQDSVDEALGRMTVIQQHTYDTRNFSEKIWQNTDSLTAKTNEIAEQWKDHQAYNAQALRHLAGIENNTNPIPRMAAQIEDIATRGVIIRGA